jgi:hypothetical protein
MNPDDIVLDLSNCISVTSPVNPRAGDIWLDTSTMSTNVYTDSYDWITITGDSGTINLDNITTLEPVEFEDHMPSVAKVEDMCNDYPALQKAYENFRTIYKMVHQDWIGKQKEDGTSI